MRKLVTILFTMLMITMLPHCKSYESRFRVTPDEPLTEFTAPINVGGLTPTDPNRGGTTTPNPNPSPTDALSSISSPELKAFMLAEGNPKDWSGTSFSQVVKIAEFFCSDCHTSSVWYGDSSTQEFYRSRDVKRRVEARTMPSPATSYEKLMDAAEAAGYDYRAAMLRYLSN